ncbi:MAG TPA: zf-HC2 domain-containing protein [Roseiflexaceae bacterium]|nr:zf-HC2 domain-containing protein [Roseiflexaceae bacterium]
MTDDTTLTCQDLVELVTDYLEGSLSAQEQARFEKHLDTCTGCRNYLGQIRLTIGALGRLTEETIPAQARDDLLSVFRDWKKAGPHA